MPYYCTVQDVANFLGVDIGIESKPNYSQVENMIEMAEAEIENRTRHAWREVSTTEIHNLGVVRIWGLGVKTHLKHRKVRAWNPALGDQLLIRYGFDWEDWSNKREGYDFTILYEEGILFVNIWWYSARDLAIRVKYRYGETEVPADVKEATIKLVACKILENENYFNLLPSGQNIMSIRERIDLWREDAERIIANRSEFVPVGY